MMSTPNLASRCVVLVAILGLCGTADAQCGPAWAPIIPDPRSSHAMAFDAARARLVVFGGSGANVADVDLDGRDTWEWDGDRWELRNVTGPSPRLGAAMVYDAARARTILFGGSPDFDGRTPHRDTWSWDGTSWTERVIPNDAPRPSSRAWHAMAYDSHRQRTVLFGGASDSDTWEWDGHAWARVATLGPSPRIRHTMSYDPLRQVVVLFGGQEYTWRLDGPELDDTWEWDGHEWARRVGQGGPSARGSHAMAFSPEIGRVVMYGGRVGMAQLADTWTYGADGWTSDDSTLGVRERSNMITDEVTGTVLLFAGGTPRVQADLWRWSKGSWQKLEDHPGSRFFGAAAADTHRQRIVMCSDAFPSTGRMQTWEWDGHDWIELPIGGPSQRIYHSMTYDSARQRVQLLDGAWSGAYRGDRWECDGARWSPLSAPGPQGGRSSSGLSYDIARARTVLTGGIGVGGYAARTWEFDGQVWFARETPINLSRWQHAQAYDPVRQRTVIVGGRNEDVRFGDTWEWDGTSWHWVSSTEEPVHPSERSESKMTFDPVSQKILLLGGATGEFNTYTNETWLWDGTRWEQVATEGPPEWRIDFLVPDPVRGHVVAFVERGMWGWQERRPPLVESGVTKLVLRSGRPGTIGVSATGSLPLQFSWSRNGDDLVDDGRRQGSATSSLTLAPAYLSDAGDYAVRVWNECGHVVSEPIEVRVVCGADTDQDGVIESDDLFAFVDAFLNQGPSADFDLSNAIDSRDLFAFLDEFFNGCG